MSKIKNYFKRVLDAKLARAEGYADGVNESTKRLAPKLNAMTERIGVLSSENLNMEAKLRKIYDERIAILESRQTKNCKDCMGLTESERERLRNTQNILLDVIQRFNIVFMKVFTHTNLVGDEHDSIIKSSARIKASRDILLQIKTEADEIIKKSLPMLSITTTEGAVEFSSKKPLTIVPQIIKEDKFSIEENFKENKVFSSNIDKTPINSEVDQSVLKEQKQNLRALVVYVLNMKGFPLMPTRWSKAKKLLKAGKAKVVKKIPFTIQLNYPTGEVKQLESC